MKVRLGPYKNKRTVRIEIEKFDTWSMDDTLALIIHPMLVQLKATKHSAPSVDDEDVPDELKSTSAPPKKNDWDTDENFFKRWDYVLDQMIWSFEQIINDYADSEFSSGEIDMSFKDGEMIKGPNHTFTVDVLGLETHHERIRKGTMLFGKYYQGLWD